MTSHAWVNGVEVQCVNLEDRGLMYGDGFFTTMRVEEGQVLNWPRHWQRLTEAVARLGFPAETVQAIEQGIVPAMDVLRQPFTGVFKIIVTRGVGRRGYIPPKMVTPTVIAQLFDADLPPLSDQTAPLTVTLSPVSASINRQLAGIKHLNVLPYVMAAQHLPEGQREALMLDDKGHVIGGIQSNAVLCLGRTLYTPEITQAGVAGTTLAALKPVAESMGYQWRAVRIHKAELMKMEGLALLNAYWGLQPVAALEGALSCRFDPEKWAGLADNLNVALRSAVQ